MNQLDDLHSYRVLISIDERYIGSMIRYCDKAIMENSVETDLIYELCLCEQRGTYDIRKMIESEIGSPGNDMPSRAAIGFIGKVYLNSRTTTSDIAKWSWGIYEYADLIGDKEREEFYGIYVWVDDLEYYGSELELRQSFQMILEPYLVYEKNFPI